MNKHTRMSYIYLAGCILILAIEIVTDVDMSDAFYACFIASVIWAATDK